MRELIVTEFMSLDGVVENPAWTMPYWGDDIAAFKGEETKSSDALLLGRVTYEGFAAAWPQRTDEESGGVYFNGVKKYVVTTTLKTLEWNNSHILEGDLVTAVNALKQQDGTNITVHGSTTLVQSLMQHDLVDRYRILVYPVVLGEGKRLFENINDQMTLKLVESKSFASGVVALIYEPDRS